VKEASDIYVTADLHLRGEADEPALFGFRNLCRRVVEERAPLYILGDLFDYWVGAGQARLPGFRTILDLIAETAKAAPIHILPGNRDFAMGTEIARIEGVTLHAGDIEATWNGHKALLTHGDLLLENDRAYQRMRRVLRSRAARWLAGRVPLRWLLRLSGGLRAASSREVGRKSPYVLDPDYGLARRWLEEGGHDALVFGHVHRGEHYRMVVGERTAEVFVLGSWEDAPNYVLWTAEGLSLRRYDPANMLADSAAC
jgi:UDP-2,3-diacylglucosamine hydrolase